MDKRIHSLRLERIGQAPEVLEPGVVYVSEEFECVLHVCPCGCGRKVSIPIGHWPGAWTHSIDGDALTLSPSLLNRGCGAHYFVRSGRVEWC